MLGQLGVQGAQTRSVRGCCTCPRVSRDVASALITINVLNVLCALSRFYISCKPIASLLRQLIRSIDFKMQASVEPVLNIFHEFDIQEYDRIL